jgi:phage shock protein C
MAQTRKLYRSRTDRKLAGVCGGLAQYLNLDVTLIRVLFVVLALLGGPGIVIYGVMWLVVPVEPEGAAYQRGGGGSLHPSARPRSWRTSGPRRLRRRSEPDLAATHGDAAGRCGEGEYAKGESATPWITASLGCVSTAGPSQAGPARQGAG